ncbi:RNA degradation presenting factor (ribosomal protein S1 homolog) [[Clostridium] ultunense Esp]|nr:RNA degradation presenting factor (ribosomal protein S1 homolog) [[Clostridium] ultunense Esp]
MSEDLKQVDELKENVENKKSAEEAPQGEGADAQIQEGADLTSQESFEGNGPEEATSVNEAVSAVPEVQVGDILTGKVSRIEEKQALIDVGFKYEAILPISEVSSLHIEKIEDVLHLGDEIEVKVKKFNPEKDELVVSKRAVAAEKAWEVLSQRFENGETFETTIVDVVKGGLVADVGLRGFIPASQVERNYVEDFSDYKGKPLKVKVIELDRENNRVILSHRAVLEEEAERRKKEVLNRLEAGQVVEGRVERITDFGAFVDLGGVDGLIHISELSWDHVEKATDAVSVGDIVKVKVLKVDRENERISLSLKATQPSPWEKAAQSIKPGDVVKGIVRRLPSFGAFVELMPGVEGLVHVSQISRKRVGTPGEVLKEGQEVEVKVLDFNLEDKRISLSMKELEEAPVPESKEWEKTNAKDEENKGFGVSIGDMIGEDMRKKLK